MGHTQVTGKIGEDFAAEHLESLGYKILGRNVRFKHNEIDIVAYDEERKMHVFVEVKTRLSRQSDAYPVRSAITREKRRCLRKAIAAYVIKNQMTGPGRIDAVCIADGKVVDHIMDLGSDFY